MGPYDQSDCIPLKAQLSDSTLDHQQYSKFKHDDGFKCRNFEIVPEAEYRNLDDLGKIDSLRISEHTDMEEFLIISPTSRHYIKKRLSFKVCTSGLKVSKRFQKQEMELFLPFPDI